MIFIQFGCFFSLSLIFCRKPEHLKFAYFSASVLNYRFHPHFFGVSQKHVHTILYKPDTSHQGFRLSMAIHHRNNIPKINCDNNSAYSGFGNVVMRGLVIFIIALMATSPVSAQLSFCQGVGGPPIFNEDFGQGTANGPPLAPGITNYTYASNSPEDGFYTLTNNMQRVITASHNTGDHTGNADGKALVVNADFTLGFSTRPLFLAFVRTLPMSLAPGFSIFMTLGATFALLPYPSMCVLRFGMPQTPVF